MVKAAVTKDKDALKYVGHIYCCINITTTTTTQNNELWRCDKRKENGLGVVNCEDLLGNIKRKLKDARDNLESP